MVPLTIVPVMFQERRWPPADSTRLLALAVVRGSAPSHSDCFCLYPQPHEPLVAGRVHIHS